MNKDEAAIIFLYIITILICIALLLLADNIETNSTAITSIKDIQPCAVQEPATSTVNPPITYREYNYETF